MSFTDRVDRELEHRRKAKAEIATLRAELDNVREAFELKDAAYRLQKEAMAQYRARIEALEAASAVLLNRYVQLVNSGDAGFWNPEEEPEVAAMRAALE